MTYIALKRLRFGAEHLEPGDEVPVEEGRNYNLMLRQGAIADLDSKVASEESAAQAQAAAKARIESLEKQLAAARGSEAPELDSLKLAELDALAVEKGIDVSGFTTKAQVVEAIEKGSEASEED